MLQLQLQKKIGKKLLSMTLLFTKICNGLFIKYKNKSKQFTKL